MRRLTTWCHRLNTPPPPPVLLQVMLHKSETSRSRVPHVTMRDIKVCAVCVCSGVWVYVHGWAG